MVKVPRLFKDEKEVAADYQRHLDDQECTGLSHKIAQDGSCQCGFFIEGKPSGTFPFVPNRSTRRRLSSFKREKYVKSKAEIKRMEKQREYEEARRKVRELARLSRRESAEDQPTLSVDLLVGAEEGNSEGDQP